MKEIGKKVESSATATVRNRLFTWHNINIGVNVGYFPGPGNDSLFSCSRLTYNNNIYIGAAALFAQFKIDQFRSIV